MRTRRGFLLLTGAAVLLALAGCGSDQSASGGDSSPTPSASASASSSAPATPTAKPTPAGPAYMPSNVLATAVLPVSAVSGGTVTDSWVEGVTQGAGYSTGLEFISGDEACRQLLEAHPVTVATGAGQEIDSANLGVSQLVESFPTVADAQAVMLQNDNQAKNCRQATVAFDDGKQFPATHKPLVADGEGDRMTALVHELTIKLGSNSNLVIVMNEHRNGGEIMFLNCYPLSSVGIDRMNALMPQATAQFESVVDAYRVDHPRP